MRSWYSGFPSPQPVFFAQCDLGAAILEQLPDVERAWVDSGMVASARAPLWRDPHRDPLGLHHDSARIGFARRFHEANQTYDPARLDTGRSDPPWSESSPWQPARWQDRGNLAGLPSANRDPRRAAHPAVRDLRWRPARAIITLLLRKIWDEAPNGVGRLILLV